MKFVVVVALCALFSSFAHADIVTATAKNFRDVVTKNEIVLLLISSGPGCARCEQVEQQMLRASSFPSPGKNWVFAMLDASKPEEQRITSHLGITPETPLPVVLLFRQGFPQVYLGHLAAESIYTHLASLTTPAANPINSKEKQKKVSALEQVHVVGYFEEPKGEAFDTFEIAAQYFQPFIQFDYTTDPKIAKAFKLKEAPSFAIIKPGERNIEYEDPKEWTREAVIRFVESNKVPLWDELRQNNAHLIWSATEPIVAAFVSETQHPKENTKVLTIFKALAKEYARKDKLLFVLIDADKYPNVLETYNVPAEAVPVLVILDKSRHEYVYTNDKDPETGAIRELSSEAARRWIEDFLSGALAKRRPLKSAPTPTQSGPVYELTANTFETEVLDAVARGERDAFVEFYAPWCGHCKALAPTWEQLAAAFKNAGVESVLIAKMDAVANDPRPEYEVSGFPTLLFFKAGQARDAPPIRYDGSREYADLLAFIKQNAGIPITREIA